MWRWIIGIRAAVAKVTPKGQLVQTILAKHLGGVEAEAILLQAD